MRASKAVVVSLVLGVILLLGAAAGAVAVGDQYRERIFPGVTVAGATAGSIDVGGLSREEARAQLVRHLPDPAQTPLTIRAAGQAWQLTWALVGQHYDIEAAVDAAYGVDRERAWWLGALSVLQSAETEITAKLAPADAALARTYVEKIAAQIAVPAVDATLSIVNGQIVSTPAQEGLELNTDAATARVLAALAQEGSDVELIPAAIPSRINTVEPACTNALAAAAEPFVVQAHDPLTGDVEQGGYRAEFAASPAEVMTWLRIVTRNDRFHLNVSPLAVRRWVATLAPLVGEERVLDVDTTTARIAVALRAAGEHHTEARIRHPETAYVVQPGDVFYDIAFLHGFPQWRLEQANPDVDPGIIDVGQVLTLPSIDVLFPYPLVPGKRIEVDLPTQSAIAYEDDTVVFELAISTGISTTPTLAGQFQILFKEEDAYAQRWSLDMPFFMGFYEEGDDFFNGFHELPITSYGTRLSRGVLGYPASYGCIILDVEDAEALYRWADVGTLVRVHGVAPGTPFGQQTLNDIAPLTGAPLTGAPPTGEQEP